MQNRWGMAAHSIIPAFRRWRLVVSTVEGPKLESKALSQNTKGWSCKLSGRVLNQFSDLI